MSLNDPQRGEGAMRRTLCLMLLMGCNEYGTTSLSLVPFEYESDQGFGTCTLNIASNLRFVTAKACSKGPSFAILGFSHEPYVRHIPITSSWEEGELRLGFLAEEAFGLLDKKPLHTQSTGDFFVSFPLKALFYERLTPFTYEMLSPLRPINDSIFAIEVADETLALFGDQVFQNQQFFGIVVAKQTTKELFVQKYQPEETAKVH